MLVKTFAPVTGNAIHIGEMITRLPLKVSNDLKNIYNNNLSNKYFTYWTIIELKQILEDGGLCYTLNLLKQMANQLFNNISNYLVSG